MFTLLYTYYRSRFYYVRASSEPWPTFRREVAGSRRPPSPWRPAQRVRISRQLDGMPRTTAEACGCPYFCSSFRYACYFHRLASRTTEQLRNDSTIPVDMVNMVQQGDYRNLNQPRYINRSLDRRPADHSVDRRFRALRLMSNSPVNHHVTPPCYDEAMGFMTSAHRPRIPSRRGQPRRHDFNINTSASARRQRSSSERHSMSPEATQLRSADVMVDFHTRSNGSDGHDRQHPFRRSGMRPTVITTRSSKQRCQWQWSPILRSVRRMTVVTCPSSIKVPMTTGIDTTWRQW